MIQWSLVAFIRFPKELVQNTGAVSTADSEETEMEFKRLYEVVPDNSVLNLEL